MTRTRGMLRGLLLGAAVALQAAPAGAQVARLSGSSTVRYIGIRPLRMDSVPADLTTGDGVLRQAPDGGRVRCVTGAAWCYRYASGDGIGLVPLLQDVSVSVWGLGRGISAFAQARGRADLGSAAETWPRADDPLDVLEAWVELDRGPVRLRGGRQWRTSGLGYFNFDGLSLLYRLDPRLSLEGFAGWSLTRGLNEPLSTEALAAVEEFAPTERGLLVGAEVRASPTPAVAVGATYQRELRADRAALYGERVALDASVRRGAAALLGEMDVDVAGRVLNEASLRLVLPPVARISGHLQARRYRPYFELWTIWSAFMPVGFSELGGGAAWRASSSPLTVSARAARRVYDDTDAALTFVDVRDAGWYVNVSAAGEPARGWRLSGSYAADLGFGAARGQGSGRLERRFGTASHAALAVHAFQRSAELRVMEGTVLGASLDAAAEVTPRARVSGAVSMYRHASEAGAPAVDWSQWRALLRLDWVVGPEPGLPGGPGRTP